jgi:hypothetical protein
VWEGRSREAPPYPDFGPFREELLVARNSCHVRAAERRRSVGRRELMKSHPGVVPPKIIFRVNYVESTRNRNINPLSLLTRFESKHNKCGKLIRVGVSDMDDVTKSGSLGERRTRGRPLAEKLWRETHPLPNHARRE